MAMNQAAREPAQQKKAAPAVLPPDGRPGEDWAQKVVTARAARELGLQLRKGKRLVFSSRDHLGH